MGEEVVMVLKLELIIGEEVACYYCDVIRAATTEHRYLGEPCTPS